MNTPRPYAPIATVTSLAFAGYNAVHDGDIHTASMVIDLLDDFTQHPSLDAHTSGAFYLATGHTTGLRSAIALHRAWADRMREAVNEARHDGVARGVQIATFGAP